MVACAFTCPGHAIFTDLIHGWVLTPGRRTITRIIGVIDPDGRRAHDAYHRLIRDGAWKMGALWRAMAVMVVEQLCPATGQVAIDLDDTLFHRSGPRVDRPGATAGAPGPR